MDGTLLTPSHKVTPRAIEAIRKLKEKGIHYFPATGRTRKSMIDATGDEFIELLGGNRETIGGVFSQGLMVYDNSGKLIYENHLALEALRLVEEYCENQRLSVIAYSGDRIFAQRHTPQIEKITHYMEPLPEIISEGLSHLHSISLKPNKLIVLEEEEVLIQHRPFIEQLIHQKATVTKAVAGMLEILPLDASKGHGVRMLLEHYGIHPDHCVAFGDGENDIEMLELVKYGIAMENGRDELIRKAFRRTLSNKNEGVANALEEILRTFDEL